MIQIQTDPILDSKVVIAPERSKRPVDHLHKQKPDSCPFCPGNEQLTPPELFKIEKDNKWIVRSVPNKYPAFTKNNNTELSGFQEVIIETNIHNQKMADYSRSHMQHVLSTYKTRIAALKKEEENKYVLVFKNHGQLAGASLAHPHSQIVALGFIPESVSKKAAQLKKYFTEKHRCYMCDFLAKSNTVFSNKSFQSILPQAARFSYETWIIPKKHNSRFESINDNELCDLAEIVLQVITALNKALNCPPFNLIVENGFETKNSKEYFHWSVQIIPRITQIAGFELATGYYINQVDPSIARIQLNNLIK